MNNHYAKFEYKRMKTVGATQLHKLNTLFSITSSSITYPWSRESLLMIKEIETGDLVECTKHFIFHHF